MDFGGFSQKMVVFPQKAEKSTFLPFLVMEDVFLCFEDFEKVENV